MHRINRTEQKISEQQRLFQGLTEGNSYSAKKTREYIQERNRTQIEESLRALRREELLTRENQAAIIAAGQHALCVMKALKTLNDADIILSKEVYLALIHAGENAGKVADILMRFNTIGILNIKQPSFFSSLFRKKKKEMSRRDKKLLSLDFKKLQAFESYISAYGNAPLALRNKNNFYNLYEADIALTDQIKHIIENAKSNATTVVNIVIRLHRNHILNNEILRRLQEDCRQKKEISVIGKTFDALIFLKSCYGNLLEDNVFSALMQHKDEEILILVRLLYRLHTHQILLDSAAQYLIIQAGNKASDIVDALIELKLCHLPLTNTSVMEIKALIHKHPSLKPYITDTLILADNDIALADCILMQLREVISKHRDTMIDRFVKLKEEGIQLKKEIVFIFMSHLSIYINETEQIANIMISLYRENMLNDMTISFFGKMNNLEEADTFFSKLLLFKTNYGVVMTDKALLDLMMLHRTKAYVLKVMDALELLYANGIFLDDKARRAFIMYQRRRVPVGERSVDALTLANQLILLKPYNVPFSEVLIRSLPGDPFSSSEEDAIVSLCHAHIPLSIDILEHIKQTSNQDINAAIGFIFLSQISGMLPEESIIRCISSIQSSADSIINTYVSLYNQAAETIKNLLLQSNFLILELKKLIIDYIGLITIPEGAQEMTIPMANFTYPSYPFSEPCTLQVVNRYLLFNLNDQGRIKNMRIHDQPSLKQLKNGMS